MGAPTVYYYDDPGAPVISNGQDAFYQVIKACLVDGYGAKAGAGWSVVYDDWAANGHASFANAGQSGILGLVRSASVNYPPFLFIADAMVDAQTGVNARSGRLPVADTSAFAEGAIETQRPVHFTGHWPAWCVIANDNWAWVWMGTSAAALFSVGGASSTAFSCCGFGALSDFWGLGTADSPELGNFIIVGGGITQRVTSATQPCNFGTYVTASVLGGTPFRRTDGSPLSGTVGSLVWPFCGRQSNISAVLAQAVSGGVVQMPLHRAVFAVDQDARNEARYLYQQGWIPGLLTNVSLANGVNTVPAGVRDLKDSLSVSGRAVYPCRMPASYLSFISMDEREWV